MATENQRGISICDALVNRTTTTQERSRLLAAFGTSGDFLRDVRRYVLGRVEQHEQTQPVAAARDAVTADVAASFTETP